MHPEWVTAARSYDIWVIYYGGDQGRLQQYRESSDKFFHGSGLKIQLLRNFILSEMFFGKKMDFTQYDYIWVPDDDIRFPDGASGLEKLFETAKKLEADVFQPAIQNEHYSWELTKQIPGVFCHRTNIVEVMANGFSGKAFARAYLPAIHALDFVKSGWGLEPIWMKIGEAELKRSLRTFVIDCCPIIHARPSGGGEGAVHAQGKFETIFLPQIKTNRIKTLAVFWSLEEAMARRAEYDKISGMTDFPPVNSVPLRIRSTQARRAIAAAGLKPFVEAAVANASAEVRDSWYTMDTIERGDPDLIKLANAIGLTSDQIDEFFRRAALM